MIQEDPILAAIAREFPPWRAAVNATRPDTLIVFVRLDPQTGLPYRVAFKVERELLVLANGER